MLTVLSTTPNWWDTEDYVCLRQVSTDMNKDIDLDVLQTGINLSHRDKFLRDRASRRVAMKRLYQCHPVDTLCQERVSKCNGVMGATFILFLILYRICSKQSQAQAARNKICNHEAIVHAVKANHAAKHCLMSPSHHKASTTIVLHCEGSWRVMVVATASPAAYREMRVITYPVFEVKGCANLLLIIQQLLLMSGDVELNPGPLDGEGNG